MALPRLLGGLFRGISSTMGSSSTAHHHPIYTQSGRPLKPAPRLFSLIPPFPSILLLSALIFTAYASLFSSLGTLYPADEWNEDSRGGPSGVGVGHAGISGEMMLGSMGESEVGGGRGGDMGDMTRVKMEAFRAAIRGGRLWCVGGMGIAGAGFWGALKDHLPSIRLFAMHSLLSFLLASLTVLSLLPLSLLPPASPISEWFSDILCSELTRGEVFFGATAPHHSELTSSSSGNHKSPSSQGGMDDPKVGWERQPEVETPWLGWAFGLGFSEDSLGWGIESCEERWRSALGFGCLLAGIGLAVVCHGVWVIWGYYRTVRASQLMATYGYSPLTGAHRRQRSRSRSYSTHSHSHSHSMRERRMSHSSPSSSSSSESLRELPTHHQPRVFLLPPTVNLPNDSKGGKRSTLPSISTSMGDPVAFAVTPPSPDAGSSDKHPSLLGIVNPNGTAPNPTPSSSSPGGVPECIVYAPISIPLSEALAMDAREAFVSGTSSGASPGHGKKRSQTYPHPHHHHHHYHRSNTRYRDDPATGANPITGYFSSSGASSSASTIKPSPSIPMSSPASSVSSTTPTITGGPMGGGNGGRTRSDSLATVVPDRARVDEPPLPSYEELEKMKRIV